MTCKDCLYYEMCYMVEHYGWSEEDGTCVNFKNKADFVEVVRCKNCKHCDHFYPSKAIGEEAVETWYCEWSKGSRLPDDFCSCGERVNYESSKNERTIKE